MGQKEKLIRKLKSNPRDFSFEEAETLLRHLDYRREQGQDERVKGAILKRQARD